MSGKKKFRLRVLQPDNARIPRQCRQETASQPALRTAKEATQEGITHALGKMSEVQEIG